jgi:two-component system response regulator
MDGQPVFVAELFEWDDMIQSTCHILLLEDDSGDVRLVEIALTSMGDAVCLHPVANGEEGLNYLSQCSQNAGVPHPNLIIVDLNMPRMNGWEFMRELRRSQIAGNVPVVMFTTSESKRDVTQAYQWGVNCFITKPFDFDQFTMVLNACVGYYRMLGLKRLNE